MLLQMLRSYAGSLFVLAIIIEFKSLFQWAFPAQTNTISVCIISQIREPLKNPDFSGEALIL